jgi:hypothetical protein
MLDKDGQTILNDLRWHWEDHYLIDYKDGAWIAAPVSDPFNIIERETSGELREAIRIDYAERVTRRQARVFADVGGWISGPSLDVKRASVWPVGNSGP